MSDQSALGDELFSARGLDEILELMPDAALAVDSAGRILSANRDVHALLGYEPRELIGQAIERLVPESLRARHVADRTAFTDAPERRPMAAMRDLVARTKDGREIDVLISLTPLATRAGEALVIASLRDISLRRAAERALRAAEERYRSLLENASDGIVVLDAAGRIVEVNRSAAEIGGYSREQLLGKQYLELLAPEERAASSERFRAIFSRAGLRTPGHDLSLVAGKVIPIEYSSTLVELQGESVALVIIRDVSERRRVQEALESSERRYRELFEHNAAGVFRATVDGTLIECNAAFARIFGYESASELAGLPCNELCVEPVERDELIERVRAEGSVANFPIRGRRRDGSEAAALVAASLVSAEEGEVLEGTVLDLTEKKLLEAQFRQAQKMEAIGQLAGGVAHDFNNLMMVVLGYVEMTLAQKPPNHADREPLEQIRASAERAVALTRQLLAFGRKQVLEPRVLDLNALLLEFGALLRRVLGDDITLEIRTGESLWPVRADPIQLEQVVLNLAVNARDAMPSGGVLTLEASNVSLDDTFTAKHPGARPGRFVRLLVRDTGVGMDAETVGRIFEPFFTTKELGRGTGLGLATVYGIVKQMEGYIGVDSHVGQGTEFTIFLQRSTESPEQVERREVATAAAGGSERILIVEDSEPLRKLVTRQLEAAGYRVTGAASSSQAIALVAEAAERFDLLLSDVELPGMSGPDLARILAQSTPGLRVLLMSGYSEQVMAGRELTALPFLQKPFSAATLVERVRDALTPDRGTADG
jgi:PAS domain S-box-containing protein